MAKRKYYAVRIGRKPGIYTEWNECELQIKGYSGAQHASFSTLEEAENYMAAETESEDDKQKQQDAEGLNSSIDSVISSLNDDEVIAFVDGSYNDKEKKAGYGAIIIDNDGNKEQLYRAITEQLDGDYIKLRNIAPELDAVKQAVSWAIKSKKRKITIYHDLEGTEKWANGGFKAKNPHTKRYATFITEKRKVIEIDFVKVPAHSGISLNEEADQLAKRSLLIKGYKNYDDGSVYFVGLNAGDWKSIAELLNDENSELENGTSIISYSSTVLGNREKIVMQQGRSKVTINCYNSNRSYAQGKESALFQRVLATAIALLDTGESVVETYNQYHAVDISREDVEVKFQELLQNYSESTSGKHYNNLLSAVYNTMLTGYRPDYTHLIMPVFRAYEYYLHRILCDKMGLLTTTAKGTNYFSYFDKTATGDYVCNSGAVSNLNPAQLIYLNKLYTNYNRIRHPYSHWAYDDIDCAVITDMTEARNLILQGLGLFDEYYTCF